MIQVNTKIIGICITIILVVSIYICLSSPFYSVREYPRLQPILDNYTVIHNEAPPLDPDAIPETDILNAIAKRNAYTKLIDNENPRKTAVPNKIGI